MQNSSARLSVRHVNREQLIELSCRAADPPHIGHPAAIGGEDARLRARRWLSGVGREPQDLSVPRIDEAHTAVDDARQPVA